MCSVHVLHACVMYVFVCVCQFCMHACLCGRRAVSQTHIDTERENLPFEVLQNAFEHCMRPASRSNALSAQSGRVFVITVQFFLHEVSVYETLRAVCRYYDFSLQCVNPP